MKKYVIFQKHAIAKSLINQVVINTEGCDTYEIEGCDMYGIEGCDMYGIEGCDMYGIEASIKVFNLIFVNNNFHKFFISTSIKITSLNLIF
jgi:hypothetical protein